MKKITYKTPIVEMQGDEMTRILWDGIKEVLLEPYVKLNTEFYDLGLENRELTADKVTSDAAEAIKRFGVGVKCATITPNAQRVEEYKLSEMWLSPNGTIRAALDGTVFRAPIMVKGITPYIPTWTKPITIARHAYGDVYKNAELSVGAGGECELSVMYADGRTERKPIYKFGEHGGVIQGVHNKDDSIASFARSCFNYALDTAQDVWFGAKDTISKTYDHRFKDIFAEVFEREYRHRFDERGIKYEYSLIDDSVARVVRSSGGFIWALKNYDGDVMSDMVATAYGSLAMMTSVLVSPDGKYEYEAAHGTVTRHYYRHLNGEETSTNPIATIFAWTGALARRGKTENNAALVDFAERLERACIATVERGIMTGDLACIFKRDGVTARTVTSREFLKAINATLLDI